MIFVFPGTASKFTGSSSIAKQVGYIEISDQDYNDLLARAKKWENGKLVANPNYEKYKQEQELATKNRQARLNALVQSKAEQAFDTSLAEINAKLCELSEAIAAVELTPAQKERLNSAVTKESLGLGNIDNTADADKPISNAVREYIETRSSDLLGAIAAATAQQNQPEKDLYLHQVHFSETNELGDKIEGWFTICNTDSAELTDETSGPIPATGYVEYFESGVTKHHTIYSFNNNEISYYNGKVTLTHGEFSDHVIKVC